MSPSNRHIILQTTFELEAWKGHNGFDLQQAVSSLVRNRLQTMLSDLFDRYADAEELIRLDKLEIDLGTIPLGQWEDVLSEKLRTSLEEQLIVHLRKKTGEVKRKSIRDHRFDQWLEFLEYGILPWEASLLTEEEWEGYLRATLIERDQAIEKLLKLLQRSRISRRRLIGQYPDTFLENLITRTPLFHMVPVGIWLKEVTAIITQSRYWLGKKLSVSSASVRRSFWESAWEAALEPLPQRVLPTVLHRMISRWIGPQELGNFFKEARLINFIRSRPEQFPVSEDLLKGLAVEESEDKTRSLGISEEKGIDLSEEASQPDKKEPEDKKTKEPLSEHMTPSEESSPPEHAPAPDDQDSQSLAPEEPIEADKSLDRTAAEKESMLSDLPKKRMNGEPKQSLSFEEEEVAPEGTAYYVHNAGMVILHPFLKSFFEKVGLLEGKAFIDPSARNRAAHLLHWLASGEIGVPEYRLVLPRFLCDIPFEFPMDRDFKITKAEKEEGESLLQGVISHWKALKQTSPDGLREGFMQREGKLQKRKEGWYLLVEQKTVDILLDRLPWGISMIKLPWKEDILRVEWS